MTEERWLPAVGWEGLYQVSDYGRVKSLQRYVRCRDGVRLVRERILKPYTQRTGYRTVLLAVDGRKKTRSIHQLVLEAFVGPRPADMVACHNDGVPNNNHVANLRWDTQSNNLFDAVRHGTNVMAAATHCKRDHEFNDENTYIDGKGWRRCHQCRRDSVNAKYVYSPRGYGATRTHCKHGHEFTGENTRLDKMGRRSCRVCANARARANYAKKRGDN